MMLQLVFLCFLEGCCGSTELPEILYVDVLGKNCSCCNLGGSGAKELWREGTEWLSSCGILGERGELDKLPAVLMEDVENRDETDEVVQKAEIDERVDGYTFMILCLVTFWFPPAWIVFGVMYFTLFPSIRTNMDATLTRQKLVVKSGPNCCSCIPYVERSIFLDRIQDVVLSQGCVQKCFNIWRLDIQTAGNSQPGPEASIPGIINAEEFREIILRQRELYVTGMADKGGKPEDRVGKADLAQQEMEETTGLSAALQETNTLLTDMKGMLADIASSLKKDEIMVDP